MTELAGRVSAVPVVLRPTVHGERSWRRLESSLDSMPLDGPLIDRFGRVHSDLRLSVTDRCNFRCTYCMPEGVAFGPIEELLSVEEIARVARVAQGLGVRTVRLTGGEPLVRAGIVDIVAALGELEFDDLAMTTNGTSLERLAERLASVGLRRVNVSCDSLQAERFSRIRRRGRLETALSAMDAAEAAGLAPLKVNVVLIEDENDDEAVEFADFARRTGRSVRFIEFMPLDAEGAWSRSKVIAGSDVLATIAAHFPLVPVEEPQSSDAWRAPATSYRFRDAPGEVGFINSVTEPFCGTCDRLRLMADGSIRNCLFSDDERSLRELLRAGASDDAIELELRRAVWAKRAGHGIDEPGFLHPSRPMSRIGG